MNRKQAGPLDRLREWLADLGAGPRPRPALVPVAVRPSRPARGPSGASGGGIYRPLRG
jgi:hypothetical protein